MVQFVNKFFFLDFFNFCWVFQKFPFFCVTLYMAPVHQYCSRNVMITTDRVWNKKPLLATAYHYCCRLRLKCDGTRAETRFRLPSKRTSPFKSSVASFQSITGSRSVRISGSNAGHIMFRGSVKSTGYPLHSPVFSSLPLPSVTVCHHISTGLYLFTTFPMDTTFIWNCIKNSRRISRKQNAIYWAICSKASWQTPVCIWKFENQTVRYFVEFLKYLDNILH